MLLATVTVSPLLAVPGALVLYVIALVGGVYVPRLIHLRRTRKRMRDDGADQKD